ncbi:hypothetical protein BD408DRAFT_339637, partial [Parasitella parasitica]
RVVMESSNSVVKENVGHTTDDTVRQIYSAITMIDSDIHHDMNASLYTMTKTAVFAIHLV